MEKSVGNGEVERIVAEPNGPADESESKAGEQHKVKVSLDEAKARYEHLRIDTTRAGEKADTFREDAYAEIGNYSITPRTFESRTYDGCGYRTVLTYRDEFIFDGNRVTRFGINSENPNLISFVKQDEIGLCSVDDKATTATKRSAKYTPKDVESVKLSTIEIKLLDDSVGSLVSGVSKVVVIDIFERQNGGDKNGYVNIKDGKVKTHSVVLYKNPSLREEEVSGGAAEEVLEILVIDPSNFLFSSHLSNYRHSGDITIKTCHTSLQIYKSPANSEGPRHDQYRDCIDVAVKIALGLNSLEYVFDCANKQNMTNSIKECSAILNLSNIDTFDITAGILGDGPARVKQTSDTTLLDVFYTARKTIKENLDALDTLDKQNLYVDRLDEIRSGCASSVTVSALPKKIIKDFIGQNNRCVELFCQIPATYQGQLLGSIEKFEEPEEAADCCWG